MSTRAEQVTVARPVSKEGIGLHTGEVCRARLLPAEPSAGVAFRLGSGCVVPGNVDHVVSSQRATALGSGEERVGNVEHLLAALYGMQVDNVMVEVEGPEIPSCDGSALEWVELLREAGRRAQGTQREAGRLGEAVWVGGGESWAVATPGRSGLALGVVVEFPGTVVGRQTLWTRVSRSRFAREVAPARTFAFIEELEGLRARGLARGGSVENAFGIGPEGYVGALRFPDEVVRHKALDLLGDVALCGVRFTGQVVAVRPSHELNVELARELRRRLVR